MSDTPRPVWIGDGVGYVPWETYERIQHELAAANERINALTQENKLAAQSIKYMDAKTRSLCERIAELERGEFICRKCGLRKDAAFEKGDF